MNDCIFPISFAINCEINLNLSMKIIFDKGSSTKINGINTLRIAEARVYTHLNALMLPLIISICSMN